MISFLTIFIFILWAGDVEVQDLSSHSCFLQKPIIVGASNSSPSQSASMLLAKSADQSPMNVAVPGAGSESQMTRLRQEIDNVQSIIALDLFFWQPGKNCSTALAHAQELINIAKDKNKFLVLATLPTAMRSMECVGTLNQYIRQNCQPPNCLVADYDRWLSGVINGGLKFGNKTYKRQDIFADQLHLNSTGSRLAQNLIAADLLKLDSNKCPFLNKEDDNGFFIEFDSVL